MIAGRFSLLVDNILASLMAAACGASCAARWRSCSAASVLPSRRCALPRLKTALLLSGWLASTCRMRDAAIAHGASRNYYLALFSDERE